MAPNHKREAKIITGLGLMGFAYIWFMILIIIFAFEQMKVWALAWLFAIPLFLYAIWNSNRRFRFLLPLTVLLHLVGSIYVFNLEMDKKNSLYTKAWMAISLIGYSGLAIPKSLKFFRHGSENKFPIGPAT